MYMSFVTGGVTIWICTYVARDRLGMPKGLKGIALDILVTCPPADSQAIMGTLVGTDVPIHQSEENLVARNERWNSSLDWALATSKVAYVQ
jgi:hypothetical protein